MGDKWRVEEITLYPMYYRYLGKEEIVLVDKANQHPDPSKKLTWGYDMKGNVVPGDFNYYFDKAGFPIKFKVRIATARTTAAQEKAQRTAGIKDFIRGYPWDSIVWP